MALYILPVSHIAPESRRRAREAFEEIKPELLAVELDFARLQALLSSASGEGKPRPSFSFSRIKESLLAFILSGIQSFLAGKVSERPGEEFILAIRLAAERGVPIALVDREISITLSRLSAELRLRTIAKLLWVVLFSAK
ncbi:MAG: TraB domain-containing protein, partial [archaeon]